MSESNNELFTFLESLRSAQENEKSPSRRSNRVNRGSSSQPSRSTDEDKDPFDTFLEDMQKSRSEDKSEDVREEDPKDEYSEPTNIMDIILGHVAKAILDRSTGSHGELEEELFKDSTCEDAEGMCEDCDEYNSAEEPQLFLDLGGLKIYTDIFEGECECEDSDSVDYDKCECEDSDSVEFNEDLVDIFGAEFVAGALEEFYAASEAGFIDGDKSAEYLFARLLDSTQTDSAMGLARLAYTLGQVSALDAVQER